LTLIQKTVFAAHENNLPVTICGELAGMITMVPLFVGMGIDQLSMNPVRIPGIADWITRFRYSDARRFASRVMRLTTADKVARALREAHDYVKRQKRGSWLK
jgi:phosphotransferase system enzyme I (PtsI)